MTDYNSDDVGTRLEHLSDLYDLWQSGLAVLERGTYHSPYEREEAERLTNALELLAQHMQWGYKATTYAQVINRLPKAKEIKDEPDESTTP